MAKIKIKISVTPVLAPSGLSFGEMAVNIVDKKIFIGNAVEGVVTLHDQNNIVTSVNGQTGAVTVSSGGVTGIVAGNGIYISGPTGNVTITNNGVLSVNGETGSIIGVAFTQSSNNFIPLQNFTAGISASAGSSFSNATVFISNLTANVDPLHVQHSSTGALKVSTSGQARSGAIKLGNSTTSTFNTFINNSDGTLTFYNGISSTGSNMLNFNTTTMNISPTIAGATFNALIRSTSGISASGGITSGSYIFAESGFRVGSSALNSQTDSYSLQSSDNGKIITVNAGTVKSITVPTGLAVGFNCTVIRVGAGRVAFSASGTTINSVDGLLEIASQHGAASLLCYASDTFNLSGNLA
jgi:hypothetical protein